MNYLTVKYPLTASLLLEGSMYNNLQQVFLSSGSITFPSLTSINLFSTNPLVSAAFPPFSGYELNSSYYYNTDDNHLYITVPSFSATGTFDVIIFNVAGYDSLSKHGLLIQNHL